MRNWEPVPIEDGSRSVLQLGDPGSGERGQARASGVTSARAPLVPLPCVLGRRVFSVSLISTSRRGAQHGGSERGSPAGDASDRAATFPRDAAATAPAEKSFLSRGEKFRARDPADFRAEETRRESRERSNRTARGSAVTDNESAQLALSPRALVS